MNISTHDDPRIVAAAERRMRNWIRLQEIEANTSAVRTAQRDAAQAIRYVTISREAGASGTAVARLLAERLGWSVYDKNLIDQVAERYGESRVMLGLVDETPNNWVYNVLGSWMDSHVITQDKYMSQVGRMIHRLARLDNGVFVGRGAQFLLPRERTFSVRIVASERYRLDQIMTLQDLDAARAKRLMHDVDRGRQEYIGRFFHQNVEDPHLYDLLVNVERLTIVGAVDQIYLALQRSAAATTAAE